MNRIWVNSNCFYESNGTVIRICYLVLLSGTQRNILGKLLLQILYSVLVLFMSLNKKFLFKFHTRVRDIFFICTFHNSGREIERFLKFEKRILGTHLFHKASDFILVVFLHQYEFHKYSVLFYSTRFFTNRLASLQQRFFFI